MTTNTPGLEIVWTNVLTESIDRDVIRWSGFHLSLAFGVNIDTNLWDGVPRGKSVFMNWQIIEVETGQRFNNTDTFVLQSLQKFPGWAMSRNFGRAAHAGIRRSRKSFDAQSSGNGLYLYRPFMTIKASSIGPDFFVETGDSKYAVGPEHYILLESSGNVPD